MIKKGDIKTVTKEKFDDAKRIFQKEQLNPLGELIKIYKKGELKGEELNKRDRIELLKYLTEYIYPKLRMKEIVEVDNNENEYLTIVTQ